MEVVVHSNAVAVRARSGVPGLAAVIMQKALLSRAILLAAAAGADPTLESSYPTRGDVGADLEVTLSRSGFAEAVRLTMTVDADNTRLVVGSTVANAHDVVIHGNAAFVLGSNISDAMKVYDISNVCQPILIDTYPHAVTRLATLITSATPLPPRP